MPQYLCTLGHQPHLSAAELDAVFSAMHVDYVALTQSTHGWFVETTDEIDGVDLMQRLGGTVKIAKKLVPEHTPSDTIVKHLMSAIPDGKIQFSVAPKDLGLTIKKMLKEENRSVRYIEPKNTATILHNNLVAKKGDFVIIHNDVFVTIGIQSMEEFSQRDYGRPGTDDVSGMLPPKLARMMINLARADTNATLLDPFCGSGTVLMEAATLGYSSLVGSDLSQKAIADTKKNMEWLAAGAKIQTPEFKLFTQDARTLDAVIKKNSVDVIVTEPYLGKPLKGDESEGMLRQQTEELADLYIEAFRTLHTLLKKGGVMVCVIPQFRHNKQWLLIECMDVIKNIGFLPTELLPKKTSLLYHRPQQHVGRAIWRLVKK